MTSYCYAHSSRRVVDVRSVGAINEAQFALAMHLISKKMNGTLQAIPASLPAHISVGLFADTAAHLGGGLDAGRASSTSVARRSSVPPTPIMTPGMVGSGATSSWTLTAEDKVKFGSFFNNLDAGKKGVLGAAEVVPFFKKSGLTDDVLSDVW